MVLFQGFASEFTFKVLLPRSIFKVLLMGSTSQDSASEVYFHSSTS